MKRRVLFLFGKETLLWRCDADHHGCNG